MGKSKNKNKKKTKESNLPNVSICTPTFNRRPFLNALIKCVNFQDYPHNKIEWIVIDDGTDKVEDVFNLEENKELLKNIKVIYHYQDEKMDLGKKRNLLHKLGTFKDDEDIIVYMDDDDYYPPERVSHSVSKLIQNKNTLCGGASELYLWFNVLDKMYKFGPYGPNHATAGTFAFKRKLLKDTSYENDAVLAEEKHFLKNYTIPFVQFDPIKTILVVSHEQNTFDKKKLLSPNNKYVKESSLKVNNFIKDKELVKFYHSKINELLRDYAPGDVKNKPKVLKEIARRDKIREDHMKQQLNNRKSGIVIKDTNNNTTRELTIQECKEYMKSKTDENIMLRRELNKLVNDIENLKKENLNLQQEIKKN